MIKYTVCLLFSVDLQQVCLIQKDHPTWQAGLLNSPGGKIESTDQSISEAASREFEEETGLKITNWRDLLMQSSVSDNYKVHYLIATTDQAALMSVRSLTSERIGIYDVTMIDRAKLVSGLEFIIPLAVYALSGKMSKEVISIRC